MALAKNIGPYVNGFARNALNRVATAIDAWINIFDPKTRARQIVWDNSDALLMDENFMRIAHAPYHCGRSVFPIILELTP